MRDIASDLTAFESYSNFNISTIESVNVAESVYNRVNKGLVPSKNMALCDLDDPILGLVPLEKSSKHGTENVGAPRPSFHRRNSIDTMSAEPIEAPLNLQEKYKGKLIMLYEIMQMAFVEQKSENKVMGK
jgi:hypothetical protein